MVRSQRQHFPPGSSVDAQPPTSAGSRSVSRTPAVGVLSRHETCRADAVRRGCSSAARCWDFGSAGLSADHRSASLRAHRVSGIRGLMGSRRADSAGGQIAVATGPSAAATLRVASMPSTPEALRALRAWRGWRRRTRPFDLSGGGMRHPANCHPSRATATFEGCEQPRAWPYARSSWSGTCGSISTRSDAGLRQPRSPFGGSPE
jgi:hypothetical protein